MNAIYRGTLSREQREDSIEVNVKDACKKARIDGNLNSNGGYIEVEGISNVDDESVIEYLGRFGFKASYNPVEEQCLGTYTPDCRYPVRHIFELSRIE
jgi:hypothetical protein